ncbi:MAG: L,D-transpeptidase [Verrucomicrobiaceae bacterium]|nr:L,D-transpeptidase [Verrucomicrobiaceae bacterium]
MRLFVLLLLCFLNLIASGRAGTVDAVTFAAQPGKLFIPVSEAVDELGWEVIRDEKGHVTRLNVLELRPGMLRQLLDGTELVSTVQLATAGAEVAVMNADGAVKVGGFFRGFTLRAGAQRVEVSLKNQRLKGWQGDRLVLETKISSGRNGATPAGEFHAGPYRSKLHFSSLYNNAPMPWSVQINRHIFIHGFSSVPDYPASHGCIRMPLTGGNAARFFYEWVLSGTPVSVKKD